MTSKDPGRDKVVINHEEQYSVRDGKTKAPTRERPVAGGKDGPGKPGRPPKARPSRP